MTGFPGAAPVFWPRTGPVPHRSLRRRFCTLWPETAPPDQDPLHNRTDNRTAQTGRRRHHPFPAPGVRAGVIAIPQKAEPPLQTSNNRTLKQWNRDERVDTTGLQQWGKTRQTTRNPAPFASRQQHSGHVDGPPPTRCKPVPDSTGKRHDHDRCVTGDGISRNRSRPGGDGRITGPNSSASVSGSGQTTTGSVTMCARKEASGADARARSAAISEVRGHLA